MRTKRAARLLLLSIPTAFLGMQEVQAQSTVRPVPRIDRHEFSLYAHASDVVVGPRSSWVDSVDVSAAPSEPATLGLRGRLRLMGDSDLSDAPGSLSTQRAGWDVLLGRRFDDGRLLAIGLETEASFYDLGGGGLGGALSDPFNDLYESRLRGTFYTPLDQRVSVFTGAEIAFGGEDEADLTSGVTAGAAIGFGYRPSESLEVSFGLAGASRLEDDAYLLPFIGIDWDLTDSTRLVAEGPEVRLEQDLSGGFELHLTADYDLRQFRLNGDGPTAGGALRDEQIDLGGALVWNTTDGVRLGLEGGLTAWRELTLLGSDGSDLGVTEVDPAPWFGFTLSASF